MRTLVFAAEQIYGAGRGGEKLQYVKQQLQKQGFDVDVNQIEAAVCELALFTPEIEVEEKVVIESLNHPE